MPKNSRVVTTYESMHKHLRRTRGSSRDQICVDCSRPAAHWSLSHKAEVVHIQEGGRAHGRYFSVNVDDYEPRCAQCHSDQDTKYGLVRAPTGVKNVVKLSCSIPGCIRPHHAKGYCDPHYRRIVKNGTVLDLRSQEQIAAELVMDYFWKVSEGTELDVTLRHMFTKIKNLRAELKG